KTFFGIPNGRRKVITQLQFAKSLMQFRPGIHGSGDADRQHASRWNCFTMQFCQLSLHLLITQTEWRTSAAIDSVEFVFLRAVNERKQTPANSIGDRLHQTERRVRSNRRVYSAATVF